MNTRDEKYLLSQKECFHTMVRSMTIGDSSFVEKEKERRLTELLTKLIQMEGTWIPVEKKNLPSFKVFKGNDGKFRIIFFDTPEYFDFKEVEIEPDETDMYLTIDIWQNSIEIGYHRNRDEIYIGKTFYKRANLKTPSHY